MRAEDVDEVVTGTELLEAMARAGEREADFEKLMDDIRAHREPVWQIGDVVRCAHGRLWMRYTSCQWQKMGSPGVFSHLRPARPLTLIDSPEARKEEARQLRNLERARDDGAPI
jgi:hypothetical protein